MLIQQLILSEQPHQLGRIRLEGGRVQLPSQRKTFASAIKRLWPGKATPQGT